MLNTLTHNFFLKLLTFESKNHIIQWSSTENLGGRAKSLEKSQVYLESNKIIKQDYQFKIKVFQTILTGLASPPIFAYS